MRFSIFIYLLLYSVIAFSTPQCQLTLHLTDKSEKILNCAYGRSGLSQNKKEGDGTTPIGHFHLRQVLYRPDKISLSQLHTTLPTRAITKEDGWCDDVNSPFYNQLIKLPFKGSYEKLYRDDDLYDIVVVVGYNDHPITKGKGSAIFLHTAMPNYQATSGCIAFSRKDLLTVVRNSTLSSILSISNSQLKLN